MIHYPLRDAYRWAPGGCCAWQHYKENKVRYSRHCTISFLDRNTYMCETYGFSSALDPEFILPVKHFFFFIATKQRSWIFTFSPQPWHDINQNRFNLVEDIPFFRCGRDRVSPVSSSQTHRSQSLSVALLQPVRHSSYLSLYFIQPSYPRSHLFYALLQVSLFSFMPVVFSSFWADFIRACCSAPRPSRITCCLPAITSLLITIQCVSDVPLGHW